MMSLSSGKVHKPASNSNFAFEDDDILAAAFETYQSQALHSSTIQSSQNSEPPFRKKPIESMVTNHHLVSHTYNSSQHEIASQNVSQKSSHSLLRLENVHDKNGHSATTETNSSNDQGNSSCPKRKLDSSRTEQTVSSSKSLASFLKKFAYNPSEVSEENISPPSINSGELKKSEDESSPVVPDCSNGNTETAKSSINDYVAEFDVDFDDDEMFDLSDAEIGKLQGNLNDTVNKPLECSFSAGEVEGKQEDFPRKAAPVMINSGQENRRITSSPTLPNSWENSFDMQCSTPIVKDTRTACTGIGLDSPGVNSSFHKTNKSLMIERSCNTTAKKRKFPGPAGALPDIPPGTNLSALKQTEPFDMNRPSDCEKEISYSQGTLEHFGRAPWQNMLKDLSSHADQSLIKHFNIRAALWKASKKRLPKHIVFPILCVLLTDITLHSNSADAVFKDETGEISGQISADVIQKYKEYMVPFTAIIIKRAEFLFNQLTVRLDNIAAIYSANGNEICLKETPFETGQLKVLQPKNNVFKKLMTERSDSSPPSCEKEEAELNDNFDSFFSDNMDDLLGSIDIDASMEC